MSISTRRQSLERVAFQQAQHAGLWLDKYLGEDRGEAKAKTTLVNEVSDIPEPDIYKRFYHNWKAALEANNITSYEATVQGRMVVGLGSESVLETSVTLHRTYGVPYIPGSALKGLAAAFAHQWLGTEDEKWRKGGKYHTFVFGNTEAAGYITFFDALYVPGSGHKGRALYPDVLTGHHQDYNSDGSKPPADWDSPNPVSFLSATGTYLIALGGTEGCDAWVRIALEILQRALAEMGVGAKTSSGYGRLKVIEKDTGSSTGSGTKGTSAPSDPNQQKVDEIVNRLAALPANRVAGEINKFFQEWRSLTISEDLRQQVARAIINKVHEAGREKASEKKDWYKELVASLGENEG